MRLWVQVFSSRQRNPNFHEALEAHLRTVVDPFVGHLSIVKVMTGRLGAGALLHNARNDFEQLRSSRKRLRDAAIQQRRHTTHGEVVGLVVDDHDTQRNAACAVGMRVDARCHGCGGAVCACWSMAAMQGNPKNSPGWVSQQWGASRAWILTRFPLCMNP